MDSLVDRHPPIRYHPARLEWRAELDTSHFVINSGEARDLLRRKQPTIRGGKVDNLLGANTRFDGALTADGNIRIDGIYQGHIETAGNVIVGASAKVLADIIASSVQVLGAVRGNITARSRLEILSTGHVWGDVKVSSLLIDEGGMFRGQCTMIVDNAEPLMLPDATPPSETVPAPDDDEPAQPLADSTPREATGTDTVKPDAGDTPS